MPGHNRLIHFKICADRYMTRAYQVGTNRTATNMHQTKFGPMPIECPPGPILLLPLAKYLSPPPITTGHLTLKMYVWFHVSSFAFLFTSVLAHLIKNYHMHYYLLRHCLIC